MSLLNIFKKKKEIRKEKVKKADQSAVGRPKAGKKTGKEPYFNPLESVKSEKRKESGKIKKAVAAKSQQKKAVSEIAYRVLNSPHITEKATDLGEENKYIFKVKPRTNKVEIKRVIKDVYGVDVVGVKIINIHRKKRRLGKQTGWIKGYKKAIVKIKEGQKIEILSR